jgi:hypothetical protein
MSGAPLRDLPATLRQQVEELLARVEATPAGAWQIKEEEHALMVSASEQCGVTLLLSAFRSSEGTAEFLRAVLHATAGAPDGVGGARNQRRQDRRVDAVPDAETQESG